MVVSNHGIVWRLLEREEINRFCFAVIQETDPIKTDGASQRTE